MNRKSKAVIISAVIGIFILLIIGFTKLETMMSQELRFSREGGFYTEAFSLRLSTNERNATIYYTLDGSEPDPLLNRDNTYQYNKRIPIEGREGEPNALSLIPTNVPNPRNDWRPPLEEIFKATVVRAVAYQGNQPISEVITHSYFVEKGIYERYTFPVISIVTDSRNLFDEEIGIYVAGALYDQEAEVPYNTGNYFERGPEWERPASMEFYEADGTKGFSQKVGLRMHGGSSRIEPQKTFRVYARSDYGQNRIQYKLFPDSEIEEFKRILLRNSGNEWGNTMFLDVLAQSLIKDMQFETQDYRPSIVFVNGEYWGIHNIRERYDDWYFQTKYGVNREEVVILEGKWKLDTGVEGDQLHYEAMLEFMETNDLNQPENYAYIQTLMDVDNFIDYQIAQIFFANIDWPQNNISFWRKRTDQYQPSAPYGHDGRWRWIVFDLDTSFGFWGTHPDTRSLELASDPEYSHNGVWGAPDWSWSTLLFRQLLESEEFQHQFVTTFLHHLDTTFEAARVLAVIDEMQALYEPEIEEHMNRWGYPASVEEWYEKIDILRDFATRRPDSLRQQLAEKFDLKGFSNRNIEE